MIHRQHESQYYSSEGLRHLQRQINELWALVDRRVEDVKVAVSPAEECMSPVTLMTYKDGELVPRDPPPALNPQPFKVIPTGRGWYQVVDSEGKPIHEGKLREAQAKVRLEMAVAAAMRGE